jgi:hypothetical protein
VWQARLVSSASGEPGGQRPLTAEAVSEFVAELVNKSDLVWVQPGELAARAVWSVWHDGAVAVVTDGLEQPNPGLADGAEVTVIVRSKDNRARQVAFLASTEELVPGSEAWEAAVAALHPQRLNAPDGDQQPKRWATDSTVWLLRPGDPVEQPGAYPADALRAEPLPTTATTLTRRPFHAGRATKKRR